MSSLWWVYKALLANAKAGQQPKVEWGLPPPLPLPAYQPQNVGARAGGQAPNIVQGMNPVAQNYGFPPGPNPAQVQAPVPTPGNNTSRVEAWPAYAVNTVDVKGKAPAGEKMEQDIASTKRHFGYT
uniref:Uncharacterized protein n=1 Tax=Ananas comosus var. bracteatus TaxID=296719 RepID=A0A6V7QW04_ANACO